MRDVVLHQLLALRCGRVSGGWPFVQHDELIRGHLQFLCTCAGGGSNAPHESREDSKHESKYRSGYLHRLDSVEMGRTVSGGRPTRFAWALNAGTSPRSTSCRRSVCTFNSVTRSLKMCSALVIGFPSPSDTGRSNDASRLLILIGKFKGSCPL